MVSSNSILRVGPNCMFEIFEKIQKFDEVKAKYLKIKRRRNKLVLNMKLKKRG